MNPQGENHANRTNWEKAKAIPVVGKRLEGLETAIHAWGWTGFIAGVVGFLLAAGLVYFGRWPAWAVSESLKNSGARVEQPVMAEIRPERVEVALSQDRPTWVSDSMYWLEKEGDRLKESKQIIEYMTAYFVSKDLPPTTAFHWALRPSPGFEITGRAFRLIKSDGTEVLQQLTLSMDSAHPGAIFFEIPECKRGSKLSVILRVSWKQNFPTRPELLNAFNSSVQ